MPFPWPNFEQLKQAVSIEQVLAQRGLLQALRRQGNRLVGPCPVHRGDSPTAFVVSLSKNLWRCFTGCDAGGDVVELVRRLDQDSYANVARYLAALAPVCSQPDRQRKAPASRSPFTPFTRALPLDHGSPWLRRKGIRPDTARRFEAGQYLGQGFLRRCLAVRLHNTEGEPLGYAGRRLDPNEAKAYGKWKLPRGFPSSQILYGFHRARRPLTRGLAVVECPWGVMRLAQLDIPAVALLGTRLSDQQRRLLGCAPSLVLLMDGDAAGAQAALRIRRQLHTHDDVRVAQMSPGCDPDDLSDADLAQIMRPFFPIHRSID